MTYQIAIVAVEGSQVHTINNVDTVDFDPKFICFMDSEKEMLAAVPIDRIIYVVALSETK